MAGLEVAFAGRSNVGKSSLINALTGRNALARTSHTPGRTQELIFFEGPDNAGFRLVDMPGYGYASAPKAKVASWTMLIHKFLQGRASLARVYVLIDGRHGLKDSRSRRAEDARQVGGELSDRAHQGRPGQGRRDSSSASPTPRRARQTSRRLSGNPGDLLAHRRRHAGIARRHGAAARRAELTMSSRLYPDPDRAGRRDGRRRRHAGGGRRASARCRTAGVGVVDAAVSRRRGAGTVALAERGVIHLRIGIAAACGFVVATALFAGDLTLRHYAGHGLFPDGRADRRHAADRKLAGACGGRGMAAAGMTSVPLVGTCRAIRPDESGSAESSPRLRSAPSGQRVEQPLCAPPANQIRTRPAANLTRPAS